MRPHVQGEKRSKRKKGNFWYEVCRGMKPGLVLHHVVALLTLFLSAICLRVSTPTSCCCVAFPLAQSFCPFLGELSAVDLSRVLYRGSSMSFLCLSGPCPNSSCVRRNSSVSLLGFCTWAASLTFWNGLHAVYWDFCGHTVVLLPC